jgi:predicted DNA-binding protein
MAAKQTYSVRLEEQQRRKLEHRSESIGLPVGHLIRSAIDDFLRQQEEKDYLSEVEARIATAINRLGRQVEKDRAEQQLVVGMLDYLREWLAFALPAVNDKSVAKEIQRERTEVFFRDLHLMMVSQGKAKITAHMAAKNATGTECPVCGTGLLKCKEGKRGLFWYCTNWDAIPKCDAKFDDAGGRPQLTAHAKA